MPYINTSTFKLALLSLLLCGLSNAATAADVEAQLSAREAYVGMPVVLQLSVHNAADYEQPTVPEIDGCDIRSAGIPSQSSQVTIINGRRSESRSVTMQYLITPRREGTFEIPPIKVRIDGRDVKTQPLRFVATRSDTGNLLFVEIDGGKDKVFVGEPLEMTLKILLKPYRDTEKDITLSEANMWQMISDQTSWGSFADRMKELAENNRRPGGQEVLRDDGQGKERSYYLYEIKATVYPKRPGKIDADDVQIVVNYPTALGRSRDPFAGFFGDSPFGGRSPLSQLMDDDFFSSPFGNRLTVSSTRPIVAEAKVGATEVLPVPTDGRPADCRGAVGRYSIVTQASPTAVSAGDSITLNIGIAGTGPMELVQAPPLAELPELTADFKVADQSLAGFVQEETKLFSTKIRPRREGITQIPAIPFSFFDPDAGKYETAMSDPISITVDKSESLSPDAIVGTRHGDDSAGRTVAANKRQPEFTNDNSAGALVSQSPATFGGWWWSFVIVPPIVWLITLFVRNRRSIGSYLPEFRSARTRCLAAIDRAAEQPALVTALVHYVDRRTGKSCPNAPAALGALRTSGLAQTAVDVETFFETCERSRFGGPSQQSLEESRQTARQLVERMEHGIRSMSKSQVRRSTPTSAKRVKLVRRIGRSVHRATILLMAGLVTLAGNNVIADESSPRTLAALTDGGKTELSETQRQTILTEAGELYSRATAMADSDSLEAKDLFAASAEKYQLLIDSGIHNSLLYRNLGNAFLQSGRLGRAIANYERAKQLDPTDTQLTVNLEFADSLVKGEQPATPDTGASAAGDSTSLHSIIQKLRTLNSTLIDFVSLKAVIWLLVVWSLVFWGIYIARAAGYRFPAWRFAAVPLLLLIMSLTSVALTTTQPASADNGIIVADNVTLYAGDGTAFDAVQSLDEAQGQRVQVLNMRGDWLQVKTRRGHVGWLKESDVELFRNV